MRPTIAISGFENGHNPVKSAVFATLREWADVELLDPNVEHPDLADAGFDCYHMARRRRASLSDLERASRGGVRTVNPPRSARLVADRFECARALRASGFDPPAFEYGRAEEITLDPPVVVKPRYELGPRRHEFATVLDGSVDFPGRRFVQRYVPHERSVKLYRLGATTAAVESGEAVRQPTTEIAVTPRLAEIADAIAEALGLSVFEVDLVGTDDLAVVDVNSVVSLRGVRNGRSIYEAFLESALEARPTAVSGAAPSRSL